MMVCSLCGKEVELPVEGVNVHYERGYFWCVYCAPIEFVDGNPRLSMFPADGKMIPATILTEANCDKVAP